MDILAASTPLGRALRAPLRIVPEGTSLPILATAARGKRWIAGSGPHSCWLGFNEYRKRKIFEREVQPGSVVWDIGANVGSYTILASVLTGAHGHVAAFEPVPGNVAFLQRHIELNALTNVAVHELAVYERSGLVGFRFDADRVLGRVDEAGAGVHVNSKTMDDLVIDGTAPVPDVVKIDVEGGEASVLRGGLDVLSTERPVVFLATHGTHLDQACRAILGRLGYRMTEIGGQMDELVARPTAWTANRYAR